VHFLNVSPASARPTLHLCARCGWTENRSAYVLPADAIGSSADEIIGTLIRPYLKDTAAGPGRSKVRGGVGVASCRPGEFVIALHDNDFLRPRGPNALNTQSRLEDKSFYLARAGVVRRPRPSLQPSTIGISCTSELPNWNITDARLEQQLALSTTLYFAIDDLAILDGRARDVYQRIQTLPIVFTKVVTSAPIIRSRRQRSNRERWPDNWDYLVRDVILDSLKLLAVNGKQENRATYRCAVLIDGRTICSTALIPRCPVRQQRWSRFPEQHGRLG